MPEHKMVRLFVALFPPNSVVERLGEEQARAKRGLQAEAVRWTPRDQIHLTMNFIGAVEAGRVGEFAGAIGNAAPGIRRFRVRAMGAGCFPDARQPRIIWGGLTDEARATVTLKKRIDQALIPLGYAPEDRTFHPHLTLGRVNWISPGDQAALASWLGSLETTEFGQWEVGRIELMRSVLAPAGAIYSVVKSFKF